MIDALRLPAVWPLDNAIARQSENVLKALGHAYHLEQGRGGSTAHIETAIAASPLPATIPAHEGPAMDRGTSGDWIGWSERHSRSTVALGFQCPGVTRTEFHFEGMARAERAKGGQT